ncbi:MAG: hypothetical protein WB696_17550, partial [Chthoniobacterales bacterium]
LVAAIIYALPRRVFFVGEDTKPIQSMTQPTFIESPYVYRDIGYNFEQEIRFVLGVNPDLSWQKPNLPGIIIELDFMKLLDWSSLFATRIELSRDIPAAEREAITTVIQCLDMAKLHRLREIAEERERREPDSRSPFTMSDEPEGLFPDLD